jgi:hypothetical protein
MCCEGQGKKTPIDSKSGEMRRACGVEGTEAMTLSNDTRVPQSPAERMRRYRKRHRRGQRIIRVQIGPNELEALVSRGFLGPNDREDTIAIEFGVSAYIDETLGDS